MFNKYIQILYLYVYVYNIYYICNKYLERADRQLAIYNDIHMFPPYPNFIHFDKLLLHSRSKEYAFSPTFKCIHQFCLFSGRKENKTSLCQGIFLLHCLFKKYISSWMQTNRIPAVSFRFWFIQSSSLHLTHDK